MLLLIGLRAIMPAPFISFNSVSASLSTRDPDIGRPEIDALVNNQCYDTMENVELESTIEKFAERVRGALAIQRS